MDTFIGLSGILIMLALILFTGMTPGLAMLLCGTIGCLVLTPSVNLNTVFAGPTGMEVWSVFSNYGFTVIPLFVLLGEAMFHAGYSERLFKVSQTWFGQRRGGLAITTLLASAGFSAICGSNTATAATMGCVALPPMTEAGYHKGLKCGSVAVGSTLGVVIPPSIVLVVYGLYTGVSISKLFAGSILPGGLLVLSFVATVLWLCARHQDWAPGGEATTLRQKIRSLGGVLEVAVLFVMIMGAMFTGIVTPTEAAGFGTFCGIAWCLARKHLNWNGLLQSVKDTLHISGMVFLILAGATVFGKFLIMTRLPNRLADAVTTLSLPPICVLIAIALCYLVGGCLMDSLAFLMISLPLFQPLIERLGFDPVWFGQLICLVTTLGAVTPPVGVSSFIVAGLSKDTDAAQVFRGTMFFLPAYAFTFLMLVLFPNGMVTWLANLVK
ncbi:MAG: TRAP transporter large permease [Victivallales bacterium]|nr:TRAP transporter large permease [Victivallales bacterium]